MSVLVETRHPGEFILSEANGQRSRETITIASGAGIIAAGAAHALEHTLSAALSARNLVQAMHAGCDAVATPCPSCLSNLKNARQRMMDVDFRTKVSGLLGEPAEAMAALPDVHSVLEVLVDRVGVDAVRAKVVRPLSGLRIAPYYGCIMTRPPRVMQFDNPENPVSMDNLLAAAGAEIVPFPFKVECCGASYGMTRRDIVSRLTGRLLAAARDAGAHAMAVACPLCQMNLDLRQSQTKLPYGPSYDMPVFYFTQLLGLALGVPTAKLGLNKLCVSAEIAFQRAQRVLAQAGEGTGPRLEERFLPGTWAAYASGEDRA